MRRRERSPSLRRLANAAASGLTAALSLGVVGALGLWAREPWIFPSLGPTILLQHSSPHKKSGSLWNTLGGHGVAMALGFGVVLLTGAASSPPVVSTGIVAPPRIEATVIAIVLSIFAQDALKADHAPGAATCLLITLGAFPPDWHSAWVLAVGIVLIAIMGHFSRNWHFKRRGLPPEP